MYRTIPPPPQRLLLFARVPELGRVKTRLAAAVGDERALEVFQNIEWGTASVFAETMLKIRGSGASIAVLPEHRDIDYVADLRAFEGGGALGDLLRGWEW